MLTLENFLSKYESQTDEELYQIYLNRHEYSDEANEALNIAVNKRGGLENLVHSFQQKQITINETERIRRETKKLCVGNNLDFLKTIIKSYVLSPTETQDIIEAQYHELKHIEEDKKIKPRTIFGSVVGGAIASVIGGILWGLHMIQMHRIFYIFIIGLVLLSYGFIRFFTKQSKGNIVVLIATILSVGGALIIGQLLFEMFG